MSFWGWAAREAFERLTEPPAPPTLLERAWDVGTTTYDDLGHASDLVLLAFPRPEDDPIEEGDE